MREREVLVGIKQIQKEYEATNRQIIEAIKV
jgi:hypothetical protein